MDPRRDAAASHRASRSSQCRPHRSLHSLCRIAKAVLMSAVPIMVKSHNSDGLAISVFDGLGKAPCAPSLCPNQQRGGIHGHQDRVTGT